MVSAPRYISNRKYSTKQLPHFSALWSLTVIPYPPKIVSSEIQ